MGQVPNKQKSRIRKSMLRATGKRINTQLPALHTLHLLHRQPPSAPRDNSARQMPHLSSTETHSVPPGIRTLLVLLGTGPPRHLRVCPLNETYHLNKRERGQKVLCFEDPERGRRQQIGSKEGKRRCPGEAPCMHGCVIIAGGGESC